MTDWLGFLHSSDEYKVMALASYGKPEYVDVFRDIVRYRGDGSYTVDAPRLVKRFGPARERGGPLEQRHFDIAHSLQRVLEETVLQLAGWLHEKTGLRKLSMAGGVALNCVMNSKLRDAGPVRRRMGATRRGRCGHRARRGAVDRLSRTQRARRPQASLDDGPCVPRPRVSRRGNRTVPEMVEGALSAA